MKTLEYESNATIYIDSSVKMSAPLDIYPLPKEPTPQPVREIINRFHILNELFDNKSKFQNETNKDNLKIRMFKCFYDDNYEIIDVSYILYISRLETEEEVEIRLSILQKRELEILEKEIKKEIDFVKRNVDLYDLGKLELKHKKMNMPTTIKEIAKNSDTVNFADISFKELNLYFEKYKNLNIVHDETKNVFRMEIKETENMADFTNRISRYKNDMLSDLNDNYSNYVFLKNKHNIITGANTLPLLTIANIIETSFNKLIKENS